MSYHFPGQLENSINAMWLSYGKSEQEIKAYHKLFPTDRRFKDSQEDDKQSFINHARLQIRIELEEIGIWILFGKNNNGSLFDRQHFKNKMQEDAYRTSIFNQLKALPEEYWIRVSDQKRNLSEFQNPTALHQFCKKDDPKRYFIIGRNYQINDPEMSEAMLPQTTLSEFKRLYPIYSMMRAPVLT